MANKLPGVTTTIKDGALGRAGRAGQVGAWAAIGASSLGRTDLIQTVGTPEEAIIAFGRGPLPEVVASGLAGARTQVHALSVTGAGQAPTAIAVPTGYTGPALAWKAMSMGNAEYSGTAEIVKGGVVGTSTFKVTLDGKEVVAVRATVAEYEIPNTGLTLTFAAGDYVAGTTWTLSAPAPLITQAALLVAVQRMLDSEQEYEWLAICGQVSGGAVSAVITMVEAAAVAGRYIHVKIMGADPAVHGADAAAWFTALTAARGTTGWAAAEAPRLQAWGGIVREATPDGTVEPRGMLGLACGMSARVRPWQAPDAVKRGPVYSCDQLLPAGLTNSQILALSNLGYATVRHIPGLRGVYITNSRMAVADTSDFVHEERRRTMDRACRLVHARQTIEYLNLEVDISPEGLEMFRLVSQQPLDRMVGRTEIISGEVSLANSIEDILATDTIKTRIRLVPLAKAVFIENEISFYIPLFTEVAA